MGKLTLILMAFTASLLTIVSKVSVVALSYEIPEICLSTRFAYDNYDIEPCIFPFKYNGVEYTSCTWASSEKTDYKPWCSTRVDSSGNHISGNWGNCESGSGCPIPSKTCFTRSGPSANKPCIFPFKFNGTEYSTCTYASSHSGEPWCSTEVDPNGNHLYGRYGKWGNCDDDCPTEYSALEDDIDYWGDDQVPQDFPAPPPYPSGQCSNGCEYDNLLKRCACWSD